MTTRPPWPLWPPWYDPMILQAAQDCSKAAAKARLAHLDGYKVAHCSRKTRHRCDDGRYYTYIILYYLLNNTAGPLTTVTTAQGTRPLLTMSTSTPPCPWHEHCCHKIVLSSYPLLLQHFRARLDRCLILPLLFQTPTSSATNQSINFFENFDPTFCIRLPKMVNSRW